MANRESSFPSNHEEGNGNNIQKAEELGKHIERLKSLLVSIGKAAPKTAGYE